MGAILATGLQRWGVNPLAGDVAKEGATAESWGAVCGWRNGKATPRGRSKRHFCRAGLWITWGDMVLRVPLTTSCKFH